MWIACFHSGLAARRIPRRPAHWLASHWFVPERIVQAEEKARKEANIHPPASNAHTPKPKGHGCRSLVLPGYNSLHAVIGPALRAGIHRWWRRCVGHACGNKHHSSGLAHRVGATGTWSKILCYHLRGDCQQVACRGVRHVKFCWCGWYFTRCGKMKIPSGNRHRRRRWPHNYRSGIVQGLMRLH